MTAIKQSSNHSSEYTSRTSFWSEDLIWKAYFRNGWFVRGFLIRFQSDPEIGCFWEVVYNGDVLFVAGSKLEAEQLTQWANEFDVDVERVIYLYTDNLTGEEFELDIRRSKKDWQVFSLTCPATELYLEHGTSGCRYETLEGVITDGIDHVKRLGKMIQNDRDRETGRSGGYNPTMIEIPYGEGYNQELAKVAGLGVEDLRTLRTIETNIYITPYFKTVLEPKSGRVIMLANGVASDKAFIFPTLGMYRGWKEGVYDKPLIEKLSRME